MVARVTRRELLAIASAGFIGLAGCSSGKKRLSGSAGDGSASNGEDSDSESGDSDSESPATISPNEALNNESLEGQEVAVEGQIASVNFQNDKVTLTLVGNESMVNKFEPQKVDPSNFEKLKVIYKGDDVPAPVLEKGRIAYVEGRLADEVINSSYLGVHSYSEG